jgi:hypothetical protein
MWRSISVSCGCCTAFLRGNARAYLLPYFLNFADLDFGMGIIFFVCLLTLLSPPFLSLRGVFAGQKQTRVIARV